jgi:hypothetical protein
LPADPGPIDRGGWLHYRALAGLTPTAVIAGVALSNENKRRIAWGWIVLVAAFFTWEALTYRGIYGWLAEWQIRHFGWYVPVLTFALPFFLIIIPALILRRNANKAEREDVEHVIDRAAGLRFAERLGKILLAGTAVMAVLAIGVALWATFVLPGKAVAVQTISVGDAGREAAVAGPARLVGGTVGRVARYGQFWFIGEKDIAFAPYTAPGADDRFATYFVQMRYRDRRTLLGQVGTPVWRGTLVEGGLPGTIRALYQGLGIRIPSRYFTLYTSEAAMRSRFYVQSVHLLLGGLVLLIFWFVQRRHIKRLREAA